MPRKKAKLVTPKTRIAAGSSKYLDGCAAYEDYGRLVCKVCKGEQRNPKDKCWSCHGSGWSPSARKEKP